jgi:hypothetical protein
MTDASNSRGSPAGLPVMGQPLQGTDARPSDDQQPDAPAVDADAQGGLNEQQDEMRAHARAQSAEGPALGGLDDTRASATEGSINDNDTL